MKSALTLACILIGFICLGQTPFASFKTTKVLTPKSTTLTNPRFLEIYGKREVTKEEVRVQNEKLKDSLRLDYFDHLNANAVFIQNGQKMFPTINGEVINYRLSIWTQKIYSSKPKPSKCDEIKDKYQRSECKDKYRQALEDNAVELRDHFLPFSIITKLSGNYVDSSAGPTNDATSFFGAPLTLRFSPAADLTPHLEKNKLFVGLNADLRLLTIADTATNKIQTSWGAYMSVGFSYLGKGFAFQTDEADRHDGVFSFSAMLYWFKSGGEFNKAVFGDYEKKQLTGVELLLRFKTSKKEDSKFNFLFGANNGFRRGAPNFAKWQFQLGIGN